MNPFGERRAVVFNTVVSRFLSTRTETGGLLALTGFTPVWLFVTVSVVLLFPRQRALL